IDVLDMNQVCLDLCKERFKYYPVKMDFYLNDGRDCSMIKNNTYGVIACFDSMVHMHPEIIENYVRQLGARLSKDGVLWLDHSGKGAKEGGHRTDMTAQRMADIGTSN